MGLLSKTRGCSATHEAAFLMTDTALFIGTGASLGIPVVGCHCEVCRSTNPKNKRYRSSLLLDLQGKKILVDAGPDIRIQALQYNIDHLDGVILTHAHHDHSAGLDDLRVYYFRNKESLPCLLSKETAEDIKKRFYFMFEVQPKEVAGTKRLRLEVLDSLSGKVDFLGVPFNYFTYDQVGMGILGIRYKNFAYVTDIKKYDESIFKELDGVDTLVVSALRFTPSHMHLTVDEAIDFIHKVNPKRAFLTHISHDLEEEKANAYLPSGIEVAYDGQLINL